MRLYIGGVYMYKKVFSMAVFISLLGACSNSNTAINSLSSEVSSISSVESITEKKEVLTVNEPEYSLENNQFKISGTADSSLIVIMKSKDNTIELSPTENHEFEYLGDLPESDDLEYELSDGQLTKIVLIESKLTLEQKEAERIEIERQKAEEESIRKAEEEESERIRKAEEEEKRKEQEAINQASREQKNALQKAKDYLNYSSFSKVGLYDQLIYEQFPNDAVQFAIDHIEVDWHDQAFQKGNDYLEYSAFSYQGLYDQLIYEGFSADQAQYAINNLP